MLDAACRRAIDRCRTFGDRPLPRSHRKRLEALLECPCNGTWDRAVHVTICPHGMTTLWRAVCDLDPTFPKVRPSMFRPWKRVPDRALLIRAIWYGTS